MMLTERLRTCTVGIVADRRLPLPLVVAYNVRRLRDDQRRTQEQLAEQLRRAGFRSWTQQLVAAFEAGERRQRNLTLEEFLALAYALEVPPDELLRFPLDDVDATVGELTMPAELAADLLAGRYDSVGVPPTAVTANPLYRPGPTTERAARALEAGVVETDRLARRLYDGRSLEEERDRRAGPGANRMTKRNVTMQLIDELQKELY
jgi:transcriptional regulator with XRE-family HTH domain